MLAIIGGTGLYELSGMRIDERVDATTPFGAPSGPIVKGRFGAHELLFLARHGGGHKLLPHEINYRANVFALKAAGATQILGFSAVGSLVEPIAPGHFAMPDQYFDWTKGGRARSFFGDGVAAHVSTAEPVSALLVGWVASHAAEAGITLHRGSITYACVEGPRLGTRAESVFLRQAGCQLVGMTNVPEAFLAREAQIAYASVGIVTDYDCWLDDPSQHASVTAILARYGQSLEHARALLASLLATEVPPEEPSIRQTLRSALLTPDSQLDPAQREWLAVLQR